MNCTEFIAIYGTVWFELMQNVDIHMCVQRNGSECSETVEYITYTPDAENAWVLLVNRLSST